MTHIKLTPAQLIQLRVAAVLHDNIAQRLRAVFFSGVLVKTDVQHLAQLGNELGKEERDFPALADQLMRG